MTRSWTIRRDVAEQFAELAAPREGAGGDEDEDDQQHDELAGLLLRQPHEAPRVGADEQRKAEGNGDGNSDEQHGRLSSDETD